MSIDDATDKLLYSGMYRRVIPAGIVAMMLGDVTDLQYAETIVENAAYGLALVVDYGVLMLYQDRLRD